MKLFHKLLVFNLLGKGVFLLVFLMLSPYLLSQLIIENTDEELIGKKRSLNSSKQVGLKILFLTKTQNKDLAPIIF